MDSEWDAAYHQLHQKQSKEFSPFCRICVPKEVVLSVIVAEKEKDEGKLHVE